jgi:hypothetical protein
MQLGEIPISEKHSSSATIIFEFVNPDEYKIPVRIITIEGKTDYDGTVISDSLTHDIHGRGMPGSATRSTVRSHIRGQAHGVNTITTAQPRKPYSYNMSPNVKINYCRIENNDISKS